MEEGKTNAQYLEGQRGRLETKTKRRPKIEQKISNFPMVMPFLFNEQKMSSKCQVTLGTADVKVKMQS